ncbi:hypothetical protein S7711_03584 [Stachybotrys chartarum IBT 7711]|uniref:4a-hydroxytetrahydrobiopterin dehydratase n=1 Tax=Stachybotrys chartarum (strain CBS 109288 / IBT 7711) TaxID=1280523 RepID=A0A084B1T9_STACB|nr:hypothetical protein S7711_03584 [Stachybotrys chartarum IBT 7711]KFA45728.1 hypothetical protein S40293_09755 [Stachybotrys chartarum IBT 40293]KFA78869.1 hypothetical protein S40288_05307 [Stachybotrys chartarum IBT 40288]
MVASRITRPAAQFKPAVKLLTHTITPRLASSVAAAMQQPRFSAGTDEAHIKPQLDTLLNSAGGRWALTAGGEALERSFKFKTFAKTWDFMTAVSLQCKVKNHHPEWSNVYNTTFIRWTTHSPKGLSEKDVTLAALCDAIARDFGELDPEPSSCELRGLADGVAASAGDCCAPKK